MPVSGPVLLVSNHASYLDPICLGLASRRPINFMAKKELFDYPFLKQALPRFNSFPVKRESSDRKALKEAINRLKSGEVVGVFPQGMRVRNKELGDGQPGAALLALMSGANVLPTAIIGSNNVMSGRKIPKFPKITVVFGKPFKISVADGDRKETIKAATKKIMSSIDRLKDESRG